MSPEVGEAGELITGNYAAAGSTPPGDFFRKRSKHSWSSWGNVAQCIFCDPNEVRLIVPIHREKTGDWLTNQPSSKEKASYTASQGLVSQPLALIRFPLSQE
mgnify:CR=1 FL=1